MIDNLIGMAKEHLGGDLMSKFGLNNEQVDQTMDVAQGSVVDTIKDKVMGGGVDSVMNIFNGGGSEEDKSSLSNDISGNFVSGLMSKVGLSSESASGIGKMVIPFIMEKFSSKDSGEASDSNGLMSMIGLGGDDIMGALKGGLGSKLGGLFG